MGAALWWNRLCYLVPQWWAGMWQAASSYGVEPESLSLWSASVSRLRPLQPNPFTSPLSLPQSQSHHIYPPSSPPASFGPLGARQEKAHSCAHTPLLVFHFLSSIFRRLPFTPPSRYPPSHTDNPSGLVVDGGVNSALWWCLRVSALYGCLSNWLSPSFLVMEPF